MNICLLQVLCGQLRTLYHLILNLESIQDSLYLTALKERDAVIAHTQRIEKSTGFGLTLKEEKQAEERIATFRNFVSNIKEQVKQMSKQCSEFVRKYLGQLAKSTNMNLQLLSVRLNFNDYYTVTS